MSVMIRSDILYVQNRNGKGSTVGERALGKWELIVENLLREQQGSGQKFGQ